MGLSWQGPCLILLWILRAPCHLTYPQSTYNPCPSQTCSTFFYHRDFKRVLLPLRLLNLPPLSLTRQDPPGTTSFKKLFLIPKDGPSASSRLPQPLSFPLYPPYSECGQGPAELASPGSLLEIKTFRPHLEPPEAEQAVLQHPQVTPAHIQAPALLITRTGIICLGSFISSQTVSLF